jgi:hypothetical protein
VAGLGEAGHGEARHGKARLGFGDFSTPAAGRPAQMAERGRWERSCRPSCFPGPPPPGAAHEAA